MLPDNHVKILHNFVEVASKDPSVLHAPELAFFRTYLEGLGATIPTPTQKSSEYAPKEESKKTEDGSKSSQFEEKEEEPEIPFPELDNSGVIEGDTDEPLPMGDLNKEVSEDDLEKANEQRDLATAAFSEGNFNDALKHYTAAIELNPGSALLHAKRASVLIKLAKPNAAIRDCDKAISINPDSAQGYKFRGRANRLLGKWIEAHKDLAAACKIDYDDVAAEWFKEVEPNAKKLQEYNRAKQRRAEEKELRERRERVERAREANKRAAEETSKSSPFGDDDDEGEIPMGGAGGMGGMGAFSKLLKDPEMLKMMEEDPTLITKLMEIMQNPVNIMKHMGDPGVAKLIQKLSAGGVFPGGGGGGFPFGGFPDGAGGPSTEAHSDVNVEEMETPEQTTQPKKAPEPDLD